MEFVLSGMPSADGLFPISVSFAATSTLCDLSVIDVTAAEGGASFPYVATASLAVEQYTIS